MNLFNKNKNKDKDKNNIALKVKDKDFIKTLNDEDINIFKKIKKTYYGYFITFVVTTLSAITTFELDTLLYKLPKGQEILLEAATILFSCIATFSCYKFYLKDKEIKKFKIEKYHPEDDK